MRVSEENRQQLKWQRLLWTGPLCFACTLVVLVALFSLSSLLPSSLLKRNVLASAEQMQKEGMFYQIKTYDRRSEIHNYADAVTLNIMMQIGGEGTLQEILKSPMYSRSGSFYTPTPDLLFESVSQDLPADAVYDRYWHGMAMVLRPLFLFLELKQIRILFVAVLLGLLALLSVQLWNCRLKGAVCFLWISALLVQLPMVGLCVEYFPVWVVMLLSSFAVLHRWDSSRTLCYVFIINGVSCAFFDFLTTETVAVVLPLALLVLLKKQNGKLGQMWTEVKNLLGYGLLWGVSYLGAFFTKWLLSGMVHGQERISVALSSFWDRQGAVAANTAIDSLYQGTFVRTSLEAAGGEHLPQMFSAVLINIRLLCGLSGKVSLEEMALIVLGIVLVMAGFAYLYRKQREELTQGYLLLLLGMAPVARMMVMNNHSLEHCFFVYRSLFATIFCFGVGVYSIVNWKYFKYKRGGKMKK